MREGIKGCRLLVPLFWAMAGLFLIAASPAAGNLQIVSVTPQAAALLPGETAELVVYYTNSGENPALSGLGLRMHYDSTRLSVEVEDIYSGGLVQVADYGDSENLDGDMATDRYRLFAWADMETQWPGEVLPVVLFKARFTAVEEFADSTEINFTAADTSLGYELGAGSASLVWYGEPADSAPDQRSQLYLAGGLNRLQVDGWLDLSVLPGQSLGDHIHIVLAEGGRLHSLAGGVAERVTITLPPGYYEYELNLNQGTIDVRNLLGTRIVALPVDGQGLSRVLVRGDTAYRLRVDLDDLSVSEELVALPSMPENSAGGASAFYLAEGTQRLTVTGPMDINPLPGNQYEQIDIVLAATDARVGDLVPAIASKARFTLDSAEQYSYALNLDQGTVEISNSTGLRVLSLPVDAQLETTQVRIGSAADFTRIRVTEGQGGTLTLAPDSLP